MVYIEYYVIENLVINYIIISCTSILTKRYNTKKNKLLGASLGGAYSVAYLYPSMNILFTVPFKIIIMSIITLISFRSKSKKDYVHVALVFYLVNIFISGSTYFIIYFTGISHLKISFLIACTYVSCELLKYIYKDLKMLKYIKELTKTININLLEKSFCCKALVDSGNLLKDPISQSDVIIVKSSVLEGFIPEKLLNINYEDIDMKKAQEIIGSLDDKTSGRVRIIPYKHAGSNKTSIIIGLKADYIEVDEQKIGNIILGISNFNDREYGAIMNPNILPGF